MQDSTEGFRLSPQQKSLWSLQQAAGGYPYRAFCAVSVEGPLQQRALERAISSVVKRHEILRTTFHRAPGIKTPFQVVAQTPRFSWQIVDIILGGHGLARGYLNRPDLTAERFVPNPFAENGSTRLYRTGDLARHLSDGDLKYLGRMDHQVKIRGYRIELGEIEVVLGRYPAVSACAVIAREDTEDRALVAYVVTHDGQAPEANSLRAFLQTQLPSYMLPPHFVWLAEMALTRSGKIDRRALPEPDRSRINSQETFIAPHGVGRKTC